ncbi:MAG TPA: NtaA/DmoA family FMN-dependent monooxygenase [Solirubrobacterales bacterium]
MIHLGLYTMAPVTHHSAATWRHPRNMPRGYAFDRKEVWQDLGRLAERGRFDFMFAADSAGVYSEYGGGFETAVAYGAQVPTFDQTVLMSMVGAVTDHIGIVATLSIMGTPPYIAARKFATLDHLTAGRAGWNVVTGHHRNAAENLGLTEQVEHDRRYDIADEYVAACRALWESWEADAVELDAGAGRFADPGKVHTVDFEGEFFRTRGPLNVHRSPQVGPVLAQAGASPRGIESAARFAELIFSIKVDQVGMKKYRDALRASAEAQGRDPDSIKVFHAIQPFVAESEEAAQELAGRHNELVPPEAGLAILSGHLGVDLSTLDPEETLADTAVPGGRGAAEMFVGPDGANTLSVAEMGRLYGRGVGTPQVIGTGTQVADWIEETFDFVGGDGFIVSPAWVPGSVEDFVDLVVPELRRRGLVRRDYVPGDTLRQHLRG